MRILISSVTLTMCKMLFDIINYVILSNYSVSNETIMKEIKKTHLEAATSM